MSMTQTFNPEATAISRSGKPSAAYTTAHNMFPNLNSFRRVLDYGCGLGQEADHHAYDKLDKYQFGDEVIRGGRDNTILGEMKDNLGEYDYVICSCVLNTIPKTSERATVIANIYRLLREGGKAIITVFTGVPKLDNSSVGSAFSRWGDGWKIDCKDGIHFQTPYTNTKLRNLVTQVLGSKVRFINTGKPGCIVIEKVA